jgi:hypothetical protein
MGAAPLMSRLLVPATLPLVALEEPGVDHPFSSRRILPRVASGTKDTHHHLIQSILRFKISHNTVVHPHLPCPSLDWECADARRRYDPFLFFLYLALFFLIVDIEYIFYLSSLTNTPHSIHYLSIS